jgi:hypothetical protein
MASGYSCPANPLFDAIVQEWRTMNIAPTTYITQPSAGWAIADLGVVLVADPAPRQQAVTLLGTDVVIRAVPTEYRWETSDGDVVTTTNPGAPWADGGDPLTFANAEHRVTITLTTTWRGEFSLNGGSTWVEAPGFADTTSASTSVHIYNPHSHRVYCTASNSCTSADLATLLDPDGDGLDNYLVPDSRIEDYLRGR